MATSASTGFEEVAALRRQALGMRLTMALISAGIGVVVLDSIAPFIWAIVIMTMQFVDVALFSSVARMSDAARGKFAWPLRLWCFVLSVAATTIAGLMWAHGTSVSAAAAAILWCAFIFRNATEAASRRDLAIAAAAPHMIAMVAVPWVCAYLNPNGGLFEKEVVLSAEALFLVQTGFYFSRQKAASDRIDQALADARAAAGRARILFDQATTTATLLDADLRYIAVSKRFCTLFDVREEDVVGRHYLDVVPWMPAAWRRGHEDALSGRSSVLAEDETKWPHGRVSFSRIEFSPWFDDDGEVRGVCVYGTDITSYVRERAEKEAASVRLALALHNLNAAVWELDVANKTLIGNDRLGEVFNTKPTYHDMAQLTPPTVHPDHRERLLQAVRRATSRRERYSIEYPLISVDGAIKWVHTNGEVFTDDDGKLARIVALSMDITERKRLEMDLIEAMRRAEKSLIDKRALLSAITRDIGGAESPREAPREIARTAEGFEELYQRLDHLLEEIDARDHALADAVQALRHARQAAESANESKSMFLANMSHELRTPLNAVIGYAEILEEDLAATTLETSVKDAGRIRVAARHLLSLINEILDLSKIEAGKMDLVLADLDIMALISEAMDTVRPAAAGKGTRLDLVVMGEFGLLRADSLRVRQCLLNLLSNACKFTENGCVTVCVRQSEDDAGRWLRIEVIDTGIGMNDEQLSRLFQPFMQADSSTTRRFGGTGLGLALTRRLAQLMGGDIVVSSAPGVGSTFSLILPANGAVAQPARRAAGQRPLALIIDDEELARDQAKRTLTPLGFDVRLAKTGTEGLDIAATAAPALILLDIRLPDQTGWEVLGALQQDSTLKQIPVIVISGEDDRAKSVALGAREHLVKPLERDQLALVAVRLVAPDSDAAKALMRA